MDSGNERLKVSAPDWDLRASDDIDVPALCTLLNLSVEDRDEYELSVSDILTRDDYLKLLYDICHFATHRQFPPPNDTVELDNPFLNNGVPSTVNAVTLFGHPGVGTQRRLRMCGSSSDPMIRLKPLANCRARTSDPGRLSDHLSVQTQHFLHIQRSWLIQR